MTPENDQFWSGAAWRLARSQHGVVTRGQLLALGLGDEAIKHRIRKGRLHRIGRGVYVVGRPELSQRGRWMAAVLSCGSKAVLSHRSAAALWGVRPDAPSNAEVSVRYASPRHRPGVCVYRRTRLREGDVTRVDGIPVTTIALTLVDLARVVDSRALERAVNEADRLNLIDPDTLYAELARYPGYRGVAALRGLLAERTFRLTDSELERRFLRLLRRQGLPLPQTGAMVNGFKVDFFWPQLGLVVETDGLRYHRTPAHRHATGSETRRTRQPG
jgi:hypothetical protein